jgi:hypothetical protein
MDRVNVFQLALTPLREGNALDVTALTAER